MKIIFVALFAIFALAQGHHLAENQPKTLLDDAIHAIEELKRIHAEAEAEAKATLQALLDSLRLHAEAAIAEGIRLIEEEIANVLAKIEELRQQAIQIGEDIEACIGSSEEQLRQLATDLLIALTRCVQGKVHEAEMIVSETILAIEGTYSTIVELEEKLDGCGSLNLICIGEVITQAGIEVTALPIKIAEEVVKAEDFLVTLKADITACAVSAAAQAAVDSGAVLGGIVGCVGDILGYNARFSSSL